jgi:hypothetical protein
MAEFPVVSTARRALHLPMIVESRGFRIANRRHTTSSPSTSCDVPLAGFKIRKCQSCFSHLSLASAKLKPENGSLGIGFQGQISIENVPEISKSGSSHHLAPGGSSATDNA